MKQVFVLFLSISVVNCFGQQGTPTPTIQSDYLKKSKNQKTAAWILLGGGAALFAAALLIPEGDDKPTSFGGLQAPGHENDGIKGALALTGALSMGCSIPLFIASGKNKRRALAVSANFKMEKSQVIRRASFADKSSPAVAVKLNF